VENEKNVKDLGLGRNDQAVRTASCLVPLLICIDANAREAGTKDPNRFRSAE